jgi:hypothetical protein
LSKEEEQLKSLMKVAYAIQTMVITELSDFEPHTARITSKKYDSMSKLPITYERCVDLANQHNALDNIFSDLWLELGESIRSLIIGNYGSIPRSLRWIIESTIFYADFQSEDGSAIEHFKWYLSEEVPLKEQRYRYLLEHIDDVNYELLDQRLILKEKFKTDLSKIKDCLNIFGDPIYPKEVKGIPGEVSELYSKFSGLSHISLQSLEEKRKR